LPAFPDQQSDSTQSGGGGGSIPTPPDLAIPNGTATISGDLSGLTVSTALSVYAVIDADSFNIYIADRADVCDLVQKKASPKNTNFLRFGAAGASFPAGTLALGGADGGLAVDGGAGGASALLAHSDSSCSLSSYGLASGTITLTTPVSAATQVVGGSFDITFQAGLQSGHFQGTFTAPVCPQAVEIVQSPMYCG
jgi:hypothetical protein